MRGLVILTNRHSALELSTQRVLDYSRALCVFQTDTPSTHGATIWKFTNPIAFTIQPRCYRGNHYPQAKFVLVTTSSY